jgi:hypothetical protein
MYAGVVSSRRRLAARRLRTELYRPRHVGARYSADRSQKFTAIVRRDGALWIGWIVEVPGVNGQGKTRPALLKSLRSALREALEMNRHDALAAAQQPYEQEVIEVETP